MTAFYNEHDAYAAQWLRNLIAAGHIAPGIVSEDDIRDLDPDYLRQFVQCHFFAGIGVWSHALRSAGWADDRPVWTGSCPCQPFSAAGQRGGEADERHLWPHFHWLIDQCRPPVVLGEQVASKDGLGWLDLVQADLEASGYAVGASDLCAAGFGGAHLRQRLYFVGLADAPRKDLGRRLQGCGEGDSALEPSRPQQRPERCGVLGGLDNSAGSRRSGPLAGAEGDSRDEARLRLPGEECGPGGMADTELYGRRQVSALDGGCREGSDAQGLDERLGDSGDERRTHAPMLGRHAADWLFCRDGKWRPVEPGTLPLADAAPARVGRLRAYGNALDAETAQGFAEAVMDVVPLVEMLS